MCYNISCRIAGGLPGPAERNNMDWDMLLKMTLAVAANVLITAGLWTLCKKRRPLSRGLSFGVGLVFGGVCVFANHIGIDYAALILNVRDIAPLSAGLFFDPLSGFIAGIRVHFIARDSP